jgi:hypothetical protein
MPDVDAWKAMFRGCGGGEDSTGILYGYGDFRTLLTKAGGTDVRDARYWTNTGGSGGAYYYDFEPPSDFAYDFTSTYNYVRYCYGF